jgi:hypothetical protein
MDSLVLTSTWAKEEFVDFLEATAVNKAEALTKKPLREKVT